MSDAEAEQGINEINRQVIAEFRANRGVVKTGRFAGTALLLLKTRGAKTGVERTNPMMYARSGNRLVVFASKNAAPQHPHWYLNLLATPQVGVEIGDEDYVTKAEVLEGAERQAVWEDAVRQFPFLAEMQARTKRQLPVIAVERR